MSSQLGNRTEEGAKSREMQVIGFEFWDLQQTGFEAAQNLKQIVHSVEEALF